MSAMLSSEIGRLLVGPQTEGSDLNLVLSELMSDAFDVLSRVHQFLLSGSAVVSKIPHFCYINYLNLLSMSFSMTLH